MKTAIYLLFIVWSCCRAVAIPPESDPLPQDVLIALRSAPTLVLLSLDPDAELHANDLSAFQGWKVLGQTSVSDPEARKRIVNAIDQSVRAGGREALCFIPHHGVSIRSGRAVHDLVICYTCGYIDIFSLGQPKRRLTIANKPEQLDALLQAAKVPLAERRR